MPRPDLSQLADLNLQSAAKMSAKRYTYLEPILKRTVEKETELLFKYINSRAVNVAANPFKFYSKKPWPALSKNYVKRKKHANFWYYKGKLQNFFDQASPARYFGRVDVQVSGLRRGINPAQNISIKVTPWPNQHPSFPTEIYNRLFAKRKIKSGKIDTEGQSIYNYVSNEDQRPILSPAMRMLMNYRINRVIRKTIVEVLSGKR